MDWETLGEFQDGWGTLKEVRHGSGDPWGCPGRVVVPSGRSRTGQLTLGEV